MAAATTELVSLLHALLDAAPLGVACVSADDEVQYANDVYRATVLDDPRSGDLRTAVAKAVLEASSPEGPLVELEVVGPAEPDDRSRQAHLVRAFRLTGTAVPAVGVLVGDARDRQSLRASEERFRAFMDNGPALTVILDRDNTPVFMGRPTLAMLGIGPDDVGRPAREVVAPEFVDSFAPILDAARDTGETQSVEVPFPLVDGSVRTMQTYYFPVPGAPGGLVGGISLDVTDARAAQRRVADAVEEEAALRRLATAVAAESSDDEVFAVVTREVGLLLHAQTTNMVRFTTGQQGRVLGCWSEPGVASVPTGTDIEMDGDTVLSRVFTTGGPARIDSYDDIPGELAARLRSLGLRSSVAAPILLQGRLWGAFTASTTAASPMPAGAEERIAHFSELVAQALANNEARSQLAASRERLVEAADGARRKLARDLHDGAQQRLVALMITLRLARLRLTGASTEGLAAVDDAIAQLTLAVEELRELAHGIHPVILTDRGLVAALRAMAARNPVPLTITTDLTERLPAPVEAALYFVCSESLANMHKHAQATTAAVRLTRDGSHVLLTIVDDGRGGASVCRGGGLEGIVDRVEALGGSVLIDSPSGEGTRVRVDLALTGRVVSVGPEPASTAG